MNVRDKLRAIKGKLKSIKIKKKVVIISIIIIAILGTAASSYMKSKKAKIKQVTTSKVVKKKVTQSSTVTGNIEAKYRNDINLNPAQKVVKVLVTEGQQVKKDDILVQLDISELESQLQKQKLTLASAEATLNQISGSGSASESINAEKGIAQVEASLEKGQRDYEDANKKFNQNQKLLSGGYISQNDVDASKKAVDDAASTVKEAQTSLANAQASLNNVSASNGDKITNQRNQIAIAKSEIEAINKKIEDSNIRANTDGKVIKVDAKENQIPKAGDMIIVDDNSQYKVSIDISQYDATKVMKGQKANIKIKGSTKKYTGSVDEIGEIAQLKPNATEKEYKVNVKLILDNPDESVKAGYEADAEIILNEKGNSIAVALDGVREDKTSKKKYVYLVNSQNKVSKKFINTGIQTDFDSEVIDGLKEGEKYILNAPQDLSEGDTVMEAPKSPTGGAKK